MTDVQATPAAVDAVKVEEPKTDNADTGADTKPTNTNGTAATASTPATETTPATPNQNGTADKIENDTDANKKAPFSEAPVEIPDIEANRKLFIGGISRDTTDESFKVCCWIINFKFTCCRRSTSNSATLPTASS